MSQQLPTNMLREKFQHPKVEDGDVWIDSCSDEVLNYVEVPLETSSVSAESSLSPIIDDLTDLFDINDSIFDQLFNEYNDEPLSELAKLSDILDVPFEKEDPDSYEIKEFPNVKRKRAKIELDVSSLKILCRQECDVPVIKIPRFDVKFVTSNITPKIERSIDKFDENFLSNTQRIDIKDNKIIDHKRAGNRDAAFRYRQKQKVKKSSVENELEKATNDMLAAKNEFLSVKQQFSTIKMIVEELLSSM